jgi:phage terminase large subunit-like protein
MIPSECIEKVRPSAGIPDGVDFAVIKHVSGKSSIVQFRSYDQGREAWQGTERGVVWFDEEPPEAVYTEGLLRTLTTKGMVLATFTPLRGLTDVALAFLPEHGGKFCVQIDWDEVPHLSDEDKADLMSSIPPYQREARTKGIPALGSGVIYPVAESAYLVEPFELPRHWPRAFAMDVGWNRTAAIWGAWDRQSDVVYLYDEHYLGESPPQIHGDAIKARGWWIPGVIDPASSGSNQKDGTALRDEYITLGLDLESADNTVEAGIHAVYRRLASGRLKVFRTLPNFMSEIRLYRRDEKGKIVKDRDHLMDCFTGDTLVQTEAGPVPIIDLVGTTGRVVTVGGGVAEYEACQKYGHRNTVRLIFDDGSEVRCTPDHRFLTEDGWVEAVDLEGMLCDTYDVSNSIGSSQCQSSSSRQPFKSSAANDIICAGSISSATARAFMSLCGSARMVLSRLATMSTTRTKTDQTTGSKIWSFSPRRNTYRITKAGMVERYRRLRLSVLRSGMEAKLALSGIVNTISTLLTGCTRGSLALATNAARNTMPLLMAWRGSVQARAKHDGASSPGWTMYRETARHAVLSSPSTSMYRASIAPKIAPKRCVSVSEAGKADVYCLTVPSTAAFVLGNGVTVHNCARYLIMSGMARAMTEPVEHYQAPVRGQSSVTGY